ncbi:hypothetical protein [Nocardiopsis alba]|uniref:hypothetical protein n=1 Tax=Nocardiopsis alba TaxID=53437 RepID=UPI000A50F015|nr:hypothetical protein [Nocardiopsis alba]
MTRLEMLLLKEGQPPTLDELGGESVLWENADTLIDSPWWFRAAETMLVEWDALQAPERAVSFINQALASTDRPAVADDILDQLVEHSGYLRSTAPQLNKLALQRADHRDTPLDAELAGVFLEASLRLVLSGSTSRYGLFSYLVDPQAPAAPPSYARKVVRALGAAYEHWREEELFLALENFAHTDVHGDAVYEMAMCRLADAANAPDRDSLVQYFCSAQALLSQAVKADEDRTDATAFLAAIEAFLAFETGQSASLKKAANQLRRTTTERSLWLMGTRTHWRAGRYDTEASWYELALDLEQADQYLDKPVTVWPNQTIQHILTVYTAHRSVRLQDPQSALGTQILVAPRIEDAFASRQGLLLQLRGLITDAPEDWDNRSAKRLLQAVDDRLHSGEPTPQEVVNPGKVHQAPKSQLVATLGAKALDEVPQEIIDFLSEQILSYESPVEPRLPVAQQQIYSDVVKTLEDCADFRTVEVRRDFIRIINLLIRFLANRTNRGRAHHGRAFSYLFSPGPGQNLPLESALQDDLLDYLDSHSEDVNVEIPDRSGGRADIEVRLSRCSVTIECKRTRGKISKKGFSRYLGQTAAYQAANVSLGVLAILDLTPKKNWIPHIRDSMWAERVKSPDADQEDRWVVVVRVPGNRETPHEM